MTKVGSKAKGGRAAATRAAEHAERSRLALQRASSIKALHPPEVAGHGSGRKGRKGVVIYLSPEAKEQLAKIAHEQRKSIQSVGTEAINLLFEAYRLKPIA
jgi:hypothetical protein